MNSEPGFEIVEPLIREAKYYRQKNVNLARVGLRYVPESIGELTEAQTLNLSSNNLTRLPEAMTRLTNLEVLVLNGNGFTALPEWICEMKGLRVLEVSANQLTSLPSSIADLNDLEILLLASNKLIEVPGCVRRLARLEKLEVSGNELTELPEWLNELQALTSIDAMNNRISSFPAALAAMPQLRSLRLQGNQSLKLPPEIVDPGDAQLILDYYLQSRGGSRPLNEAKLILVGRGSVGKTSIVNRLLQGKFNPKEQKTDGIGITGWAIRIADQKVRLNIWDFGGQEIMHATHQFFLTKRSLYLLVLNAREGEQDANVEYWLKMIESFGAESPVIIVINKIKDHTFDLNRRGLREKYAFIKDFVQTDCESGFGLPELRRIVEQETDKLEHLRDPFPAAWFAIKERLSRMQKSYIPYAEYRSLCESNNVAETLSQETLIGFLHNLGTVLSFRDDARLCDLNVLNPEWVTNGIYKLLNAERLSRAGGELNATDLPKLLDASVYPSETHGYLLDLMGKFELCFEFEGAKGTRFLIPELLGKEEPDLQEWDNKPSLKFQYHYDILPEGLLPRFIVRTHHLIQGNARWRSGVILMYEKNEVLVRADVQDRKIFIAVRGEEDGRRRLLAIVRSHFDQIHRSIPKLIPEERVPIPGTTTATVTYRHLLNLEANGVRQHWVDGTEDPISVKDVLNGYETATDREKQRLLEPQQSKMIHIAHVENLQMQGDSMENIGHDKQTLNITGGSFVNSPVAVHQLLKNSYNAIQEATNAELKNHLEQLHSQVIELMSNLPEQQVAEVKENFETLTKEALKAEPRRKWFELSKEGLLEAAETAKRLMGPIADTLTAITKSIFPD